MKAKIIMPLIWVVSCFLFVLMRVYKPFSPAIRFSLTLLWVVWTLYFLFAMFIILAFGSEEKPGVRPKTEGIISRIAGEFMKFLMQIGGGIGESD